MFRHFSIRFIAFALGISTHQHTTCQFESPHPSTLTRFWVVSVLCTSVKLRHCLFRWHGRCDSALCLLLLLPPSALRSFRPPHWISWCWTPKESQFIECSQNSHQCNRSSLPNLWVSFWVRVRWSFDYNSELILFVFYRFLLNRFVIRRARITWSLDASSNANYWIVAELV